MTRLQKKRLGRFLIIAAAVLWGLAGVCVKGITWGTMSKVAARSIIALVMLLIVKLIICKKENKPFKLDLSKDNILGAIMISATGVLYVAAIVKTTAGTAIVLQYIAPILVFLFEVIFQHRPAKIEKYFITAAVFGGIVLSFYDNLAPTYILGNILALLSGVTFAGQIIVMNKEGTNSEDTLIISCIISFIVALPFTFFDKNLVFDASNIIWVLILGVFQYGLANIIFGFGIKMINKVEASLLLTIEPIFNPIPVALLGMETMGNLAIIGSVIVIFFVTLYGLLPTIERRFGRSKPIGEAIKTIWHS